ncbi:poly-gamma-glutamate hydrolase family protein [Priestia filamentosa]|uniref:poly-gamma-glutamate hydrolase family protein n=1 Tax=Priestia filamentosa TaxID=1402861 RepID=UPI0039825F7E
MADLYASMTELKSKTVEGKDWRIDTIDTDSDILISAIHGGGIEIGTSEACTLTQELGGYDSFTFETLRSTGNAGLHVTSVNYDEPTMVQMVTDSLQHVAIHGAAGNTPIAYIGGVDFTLRNTIWEEMVKRGLNAQIAAPNIIGEQPNNVSNRTMRGACCQLELTTQFRKNFFVNGDWARDKRKDRNNWTQELYNFCESIVIGIEKCRKKYHMDMHTSYNLDFYGDLGYQK